MDKADIEEARKLSKKLSNFKTDHYLCLVSAKEANKWGKIHNYPKWPKDAWGIYAKEANGYKWAIERIPYFYEEDLLKVLNISDTDRELLVKKVLNG